MQAPSVSSLSVSRWRGCGISGTRVHVEPCVPRGVEPGVARVWSQGKKGEAARANKVC